MNNLFNSEVKFLQWFQTDPGNFYKLGEISTVLSTLSAW